MNGPESNQPNPDDLDLTARFEANQEPPPEELIDTVMANLPAQPGRRGASPWRSLWPAGGRWVLPALAGAAAAAAILLSIGPQPAPVATAGVTFMLHAPTARQVDLVGSFNTWQAGDIQLQGPDATGRWTITVPLPEGRHEYLFLVDDQEWVTDIHAPFHREDGFGNLNAVIDVGTKESG